MLNLQALGDLRNSWSPARGQALQCQHELVLPRLQSCLTGVLLTEVQEAPDLVSQLRQRLVIDKIEASNHGNLSSPALLPLCIVARHRVGYSSGFHDGGHRGSPCWPCK